MLDIMTRSTKHFTVVNVISKVRKMLPRFNMVNYNLTGFKFLGTNLTVGFVSSYAEHSPFVIQKIVSPFLVIAKILLGVFAFSDTLLRRVKLIRASSAAKSSSIKVVGVRIKTLITYYALFICFLFEHQYKCTLRYNRCQNV